eukprot:UC1_evm3s444
MAAAYAVAMGLGGGGGGGGELGADTGAAASSSSTTGLPPATAATDLTDYASAFESLCDVVGALLRGPVDEAAHSQANDWLLSFRKSDEALPVSIQLLWRALDADFALVGEAAVIAAQVVAFAVSRSRYATQEDHLSQLVQLSLVYASVRPVAVQIHKAIATVAVRQLDLDILVPQIAQWYQDSATTTRCAGGADEAATTVATTTAAAATSAQLAVVGVLTLVPEIAVGKRLSVPPARRIALQQYLRQAGQANAGAVLDAILTESFCVAESTGDGYHPSSSRTHLTDACFTCLISWLTNSDMQWVSLAPLLAAGYRIMRECPVDPGAAHEACLLGLAACPSGVEMRQQIDELLPLSASAPVAAPVCQLFVDTGCAALRHADDEASVMLLREPLEVLVDTLLACAQSEDFKLTTDVHKFWYALADHVKSRPHLRDQFFPLARNAVETMVLRATYPSEFESSWNPADIEAYHAHREGVRNALRALFPAFPVLQAWYLEWACTHLRALVPGDATTVTVSASNGTDAAGSSSHSSDGASAQQPVDGSQVWEPAEAIWHGTSAVAKFLFMTDNDTDLDDLRVQLLGYIAHAPRVEGIQLTICLFLGLLGPWLAARPEAYFYAVQHLVNALPLNMAEGPVYTMVLPDQEDHMSVVSLMKLTRSSLSVAGMVYSLLAETYEGVLSGTNSVILSPQSDLVLLQSVCQALAQTGDPSLSEECTGFLLHKLRHRATIEPQCELEQELRRLTTLVRYATSDTNAVAMGSLLINAFDTEIGGGSDGDGSRGDSGSGGGSGGGGGGGDCGGDRGGWLLQELLLRCWSSITMSCAKDLSVAIVVSPAGRIENVGYAISLLWSRIMANSPVSFGLDVLKVCAETYAESDVVISQLQRTIHGLLSSVSLAELVSEDGDMRLPAALFTCLSACVAASPVIISGSLQVLLGELTIGFLGSGSRALLDGQLAKATIAFVCECLSQVLNQGPLAAELSQVLSDDTIGFGLVFGIMVCCCGGMPSWMLNDLSKALLSLYRTCGVELCCRWATAAASAPAFPRSTVRQEVKDKFVSDLAKFAQPPGAAQPQPNWGKFKQTLKQFCGGKKKRDHVLTPKNKDLRVA